MVPSLSQHYTLGWLPAGCQPVVVPDVAGATGVDDSIKTFAVLVLHHLVAIRESPNAPQKF